MVVWSVIVLLVILLAIVSWYIYYILRMAFKEMNDGSDDPTESEELLQFQSDKGESGS